ncbi:TetR family transcriptional regulator [Streptomyces sp. YIM 98790]|uniref:TetR/AcrR family transcriptional regulator n=1 Tax=Streptomyces sp. YIM 98790 TaxID=2689077 RepID=UPI0028BD594C|nr:TetR family transcriptional regulator [Streptomyces sp. YIM 98790]
MKSGRTEKSEQTRTRILQSAMRLFEERGYDKTTMRAIAQEAGVSVGNAYYYFASKEHLIQGFYDRIAAEHRAAVRDVLARETDLAARLRGVMLVWLDIAEPYHRFAAQFFKNAADPDSPLSPFSPESSGPREAAIDVYREVLSGARVKADPELAEMLPQLLWLQQMGLVLYWAHDRSPGCARSRRLVERAAPLAATAVSLSRYRVLRPVVREIRDILHDFLLPSDQAEEARERGGGRSAGPGGERTGGEGTGGERTGGERTGGEGTGGERTGGKDDRKDSGGPQGGAGR